MILRNHLYEKDSGDARDVPRAPWESRGSPGHAPGDAPGTRGRPWDAWGTRLGPLGDIPETPWGHPWHTRRRLWDPGGPPGTPMGPLTDNKRSDFDKYTAPEALHCCVRTCLLGPIAGRTRPGRFHYKKVAKIKKLPPGPRITPRLGYEGSGPSPHYVDP